MHNRFYKLSFLPFAAVLILRALPSPLPAQEALKSVEEEYYNFLSLQGLVKRPTLNYRTLSDSVWNIDADNESGETPPHPWQNLNLGKKHRLFGKATFRVYGPELFMSGNTAAPYGQNDGALWQGRGFNASLTAGIRFEAYGVEATFKPQFSFSQNVAFDIMKPQMSGANYAGKGNTYGYFWGIVDAPQRFGDEPFFTWDWGDSEIRYTWKTLTIGFGTQTIWLGPANLNSMLHSNNAPSYPKLDIGLRRQRVTLPWLDWYIGDVEARLWVGCLSESNYFDNNASNDYTMFHGLSFAYAPSFLPGLTLFANRVALVPWSWENLKYIIPKDKNTIEDQKASFGVSWIFPPVGLEIYGELGVDDFIKNGFDGEIEGYIRYPFHTMLYTIGLKKSIQLLPKYNLYGELYFEWNSMEMSQDFQFQWAYSPYFHSIIRQGYTNRGQWLGAGSGWGGNSQILGFRVYYPKGTTAFFIQRNNPDNNYLYSKAVYASANNGELAKSFVSWKANFVAGLNTNYYLSNFINFGGGLTYNLIINPYYYDNRTDFNKDEFINNISISLLLKVFI